MRNVDLIRVRHMLDAAGEIERFLMGKMEAIKTCVLPDLSPVPYPRWKGCRG